MTFTAPLIEQYVILFSTYKVISMLIWIEQMHTARAEYVCLVVYFTDFAENVIYCDPVKYYKSVLFILK